MTSPAALARTLTLRLFILEAAHAATGDPISPDALELLRDMAGTLCALTDVEPNDCAADARDEIAASLEAARAVQKARAVL